MCLNDNTITRLHYLRHLDVSLSAAWFGKDSFRRRKYRLCNAGARIFHTRHWEDYDEWTEGGRLAVIEFEGPPRSPSPIIFNPIDIDIKASLEQYLKKQLAGTPADAFSLRNREKGGGGGEEYTPAKCVKRRPRVEVLIVTSSQHKIHSYDAGVFLLGSASRMG